MGSKVVIIGVDGANNTTGKLLGIDSKRFYPLMSTIPPYTPPAWTSILTGVTPAKHGIVGWQKLDFRTREISLGNSYDVRVLRLTELLDIAGKSSVLINLPMTYPFSGIKHKNRTIIVSDWAAPIQSVYPKSLTEKYKDYLIESPHRWWINKSKKDRVEYTKKIREYLDTRLGLYYSLLENHDWDLYFIVFSEVDWISHAIPEILEGKMSSDVKRIGRMIAKFIESSKEVADVLFIVSDHGFGIKEKTLNVNAILSRGGFLRPSISFSRKLYMHLANIGHKLLPNHIQEKLLRTIKSPTINSLEGVLRDKNTKAIMIEPATWGIYVQDNSIITDIVNYLKNFNTVKNVMLFQDLYGVKPQYPVPDIFIIPKRNVTFSLKLDGDIEEDVYISDHDLHGIFYAWGDGILESFSFDKLPTVYDIAPTVLHIMDLPIPRYTDGDVLMEIFTENSEYATRPLKYIKTPILNLNRKFKKLKK